MRSVLTILLLATLGAEAEQRGQNAAPGQNDTPTLSVRSQIVIETVVVKDKKGNTIDGLTAKDFVLTEDGVVQTIRFSDKQTLPSAADATPIPPLDKEKLRIFNKLSLGQIATDKTGNVRY